MGFRIVGKFEMMFRVFCSFLQRILCNLRLDQILMGTLHIFHIYLIFHNCKLSSRNFSYQQ